MVLKCKAGWLANAVLVLGLLCSMRGWAQDAIPAKTVTPAGYAASAMPEPTAKATATESYTVPAGTILSLTAAKPVRLSTIKPGRELDAELSRAVWVVDRKVIPAGVRVHLVVDSVEKHRSGKKGIATALEDARSLGFDRKFDYHVIFRSSTIVFPDGTSSPISVTLLQSVEAVRVQAKGAELQVGESSGTALAKNLPGVGRVEDIKKKSEAARELRHPLITLQLQQPLTESLPALPAVAPVSEGQPITLPAGTHARLLLLSRLDAAATKEGDIFSTRLLEPIVVDGRLALAEGTVLQGHVKRIVKPRVLSRPASLFLTIDRIAPQNGVAQDISASLQSMEVDKATAMSIDAEGGVHAHAPGAKGVLKQLVVAEAANSLADEAVELAIHVAAPYAGASLALATLVLRHGNDVVVPQYSELQVIFNRPITLPAPVTPTAPPAAPAATSALAPAPPHEQK